MMASWWILPSTKFASRCSDPAALNPALAEANAAGIKTISVDAYVTAHLKDTFEAFPDMHLFEDDYTLFTNTEEAATVITWTFQGTMTGPSKEAGIPATGKQVTISGTTINRFSNGLVSEYAIVYDGLDFMQQLGALPRAEGIGFKALVMTDILAGKAVGQAGALVDRARHVLKR